LQGPYCLDFNGDSICDVDFNNGKQIIYDVETQREIEQLNSRDSDNSRDNDDDDNDNGNDSNDNDSDDLPQEGGCQREDDYCDADEGCRSESVDCIDDRGFDEDDYDG
jgi:hypothetical protein